MKGLLRFTTLLFLGVLISTCNQKVQYGFSEAEIAEFEVINLCHCHEYLLLRDFDYVKWDSDTSKTLYLKEIENLTFWQYLTGGLHNQYYQKKYDDSSYLKNGISIYFGSELDFRRLDSLYYEPIVQHYVKEQNKAEILPYLGLGDRNSFLDCYFKIKEIPLEQELEYFLKANPRPPL